MADKFVSNLLNLCGENMERLSDCKYLRQQDVVFAKSSFA